MKYFLKYTTHNEYEESFIQITPQVSLCKKENHVNYRETKSSKAQYFTVESLEDNNIITLYQGTQTNVITIQVSIDDGKTWTSFTSSASTSQTLGTLNNGQRMLFKGTNTRINSGSTIATAIRILTSKTCNLLGNLCSIINENTFETLTNSPNYNYCFAHIFATNVVNEEELSCKVVDASKLLILEPSTTGGNYSYYQTFYACSTLKFAPKSLGSNMKAHYLYALMFKNCTNLIKAPELPSLTVYTQGYLELFYGCTSLETAPYIAATALSSGGSAHFQGMFKNCTNLKNVQDELQIINLNNSTYYQMFMNCSSLTKAPNLPATIVKASCYRDMFNGCTSLLHCPIINGTNTDVSTPFFGMFRYCSSLLDVPPTLPSGNLGHQFYYYMFGDCSKITQTPTFSFDGHSATGVTDTCCGMFSGCTSLVTCNVTINTTEFHASDCNAMFKNCSSMTNAPTIVVNTLTGASCLKETFNGCTSLTSVNITFNATELTTACYNAIFMNCENLTFTNIPILPASVLAVQCYSNMYRNCKSITNANITLSATTIPDSAYYCMFMDCISLVTGPTFTINTLEGTSNNCTNMFNNCQSLISVNCTINTTTILKNCYNCMFANCYSLPEIPVKKLLATTPAESCYSQMFYNIGKNNSNFDGTKQVEICLTTLAKNCMYYMFAYTKVSNVKAAFTTTPSTTYTNNWLYSVSSTGTFYKNSAATWNVRNTHGVPTSWTIQTYTP